MKEDKSIGEEYYKCLNSPYYYATKYLLVDGKPFTTNYTEEEFNKIAKINIIPNFIKLKFRKRW